MTVESANIASTFLADMFGASTAAPVYISSLPNADAKEREPGERHVATREPDHVEAFLQKWDRKDRALYFAVATVKPGSATRSKGTLAELNGLHVDIDAKAIRVGLAEAAQRLREVLHLPGKVVASGGGLHAYWLFKEALPATPESVERVEALLRLLADHLGGDPACAEASRLMRLPGSHNTKDGAWTEVRVVEDRPLRYEIDDLAEWLETASPVIWRKPSGGNGQDQDVERNPWLAVAERFGVKPPIDVEARLAAMGYQGPGDAGIHATQISVSAALLNRGVSTDEVVDVLLTATRAAAGSFGERWNWQRETRAIRQMCESWLTKHPEKRVTEDTATKKDQSPDTSSSATADLFDPWQRFSAPPFPLEILPPTIRHFAATQSEVIGCDKSALAMACLAALSGAIDHRFALKIMRHGDWWTSPRLWVLLV
ncbi:MAG: DNA-primase RepB domain-containing protein, partial [Methyloceanibacter sp.]